ncbi:protein-L-isoaspartate(D-aspartate) O-methyltransferase [Marinobacterium sp. D7]|uniref:protein-L-isoaspartate(D-aspartate) O-methyltransferase n=1 Tax=Marinobacterium ramblicola TaxID=2849041 RepID=UPI001C2CCE39|nr:protein-L-isoaspartate(D-aspartate) O-methyltransferase [Marinobacterium ramblicola]MBV1788830.1 protein-L-isoaspartate(D-aspartate) O-methyltransferase [Marinobacterium ramblicola]
MTSKRTRDRLISRLREQGIQNEKVLNVIRDTPRHIFIDEALSHRAYEDTALPIGFNQTISQPYIVARMTELLLEDGPRQNVLEVGTGSGYQTAVLAQLVGQVFSVERIRGLQEKARKRIQQLRLRNVMFRHTDGGMGWPDKGPFDGIMVTAAPEQVPQELLDQLAVGGVLVIPVGDGQGQVLMKISRVAEDQFERKVLEPVRFVPLLAGVIR